MSSEYLREFVNERLTAAAQEILGVFKSTIVKYEEELDRQRRLLAVVLKPRIRLHRIELPQQHVCKEEEVLSEQQLCIEERNSSVEQEEPEPPQIKEEEEELCTSQEGEQFVLKQETDASMLTPTHEERDHSEDQTLNFSPDDTFTAEKEFEVNTPVISSVILEEHNYHQLLSHNFHELPEIHRNTQTVPSTCEQGRDGTPWRSIQPGGHSGRQQSQNVLTETTGPTAHAKRNIEDALSAFTCLLDRNMLRHIQDCTVAEAHRMEEDSLWDLSITELKAFMALLYVRGAYSRNIETESFWSEEWGLAFFAATRPRNRFKDIMRYLGFDMKYRQTCPPEQRQIACIACYKPGACITVDEQLFPTKARCPFTQYMANKPDKFGIKFWLAADVETKYLLNGLPYLGKDTTRPAQQRLGESVVMELMEPYVGKG
ncbi:uncharacterized protein LOC125890554 isoform X5 [Epinephelus fuscoguttatus]|uniref:uncharacterized protein LOC125890554 isoform X5 n=1 Tax=Epinephelus fuscoguttatus TaxID=293821 RepID=UPI0020D14509|nr:uncharacterized protein LOC125890554 isoform X5 [Epinephelus fuscoguttatus]